MAERGSYNEFDMPRILVPTRYLQKEENDDTAFSTVLSQQQQKVKKKNESKKKKKIKGGEGSAKQSTEIAALTMESSASSTNESSCLDPNGPKPIILISLGRSGSTPTWEVMGGLSGLRTKSVEYTGKNGAESGKFFKSKSGYTWMTNLLCKYQTKYPTAGIVGFKWKPSEAIYTPPAIEGLKKIAALGIKVVRNRRNLLDVIISRTKHGILTESKHLLHRRAHCPIGDMNCLGLHQNATTNLIFDPKELLMKLRALNDKENRVDQHLIELDVPHVNVMYDELYYPESTCSTEEWMKVFQFIGVGPTSNLTMTDVQGAMNWSATTSSRNHRKTIGNYDEIAKILKDTEFENLLRDGGDDDNICSTDTTAEGDGESKQDHSARPDETIAAPVSVTASKLVDSRNVETVGEMKNKATDNQINNNESSSLNNKNTTAATTSTHSLDYVPFLSKYTSTQRYSDICFYGSTRFFFTEKRSKEYGEAMLNSLRDIALPSYNNAMISEDSQTPIRVLAPIKSDNPSIPPAEVLRARLQPAADKLSKIQVDFSENAYKNAQKEFDKTPCSWVVLVKLDADDALMPGYFDWLAQTVVPELDREGLRGALVGSRHSPRVGYGNGDCFAYFPRKGTGFHFGGEAQGQTRILRREAFVAMGKPFEAPGHTRGLVSLRRGVYEKILKQDPPEDILSITDQKIVMNYPLQQSKNDEMTAITGIKMIDTAEAGFGPAGLYLKTPASKHFGREYHTLLAEDKKTCTKEVWSNEIIQKATSQNAIRGMNFDFVYDSLNETFDDQTESLNHDLKK